MVVGYQPRICLERWKKKAKSPIRAIFFVE